MVGIYYGLAKGKTCACIGATIRAAMKGKNVLYVQFIRDEVEQAKKAFSFFPEITLLNSSAELNDTILLDEDKKSQAKIAYNALFDSATKMVISRKFDMIILDSVFDVVENNLLSPSDLYEFLSNAPDSLEIICTGIKANEKFKDLSSYSINLSEDTK